MYRIIIKISAEKFLRKQDKQTQQKLYDVIKLLPNGNDIKKLKGFDNKYRLRVNNYRIIFDKYDEKYISEVIKIETRGQVYKSL